MIEHLAEQECGDGAGRDREEGVDHGTVPGILRRRHCRVERRPVDPEEE